MREEEMARLVRDTYGRFNEEEWRALTEEERRNAYVRMVRGVWVRGIVFGATFGFGLSGIFTILAVLFFRWII